ncbi:hypothetical protein EON64_02180, partial [archaeon]
MKRLSLLVKNKTEIIGSAQKLRLAISNVDSLETSDLSVFEANQLKKWIQGINIHYILVECTQALIFNYVYVCIGRISGRQCMLSLLDYRQTNSAYTALSPSEDFDVISMMRSVAYLPPHFLCDAGGLYDEVFRHPPCLVIKRVVEDMLGKAQEQQSASMGLKQINTALKQIKIDALVGRGGEKEVEAPEQDANAPRTSAQQGVSENDRMYLAQITVELIRIHICTTHTNNSLHSSVARAPEDASLAGILGSALGQVYSPESSGPVSVEQKHIAHHLSRSVPELLGTVHSLPAEELEAFNLSLKTHVHTLS